MAVTRWVLKYEPFSYTTDVDMYYLPTYPTPVLRLATQFSSVSSAIAVGILHRTMDEQHKEAVVMQVDVEEDTVFPSKDVKDQPLPPK